MATVTGIHVLYQLDAMRLCLEQAFQQLEMPVEWHETLESLLEGAGERAIVIVDLDGLAGPVLQQLEALRSAFSGSELIALSSSDSAQSALRVLRSGFSDFLVKPFSPEELLWSIRKARSRAGLLGSRIDKPFGPQGAAVQIAACPSASVARLCTLESLLALTGAKRAVWLDRKGRAVSSLPWRTIPRPSHQRLAGLPSRRFRVFRSVSGRSRTVWIPCSSSEEGGIVLWGIPRAFTREVRKAAQFLLRHAEIALTQLIELEESRRQSFIDDLTGLYNARYLRLALLAAVAKAQRTGMGFSLLFIDVDHFKSVNDQHGHLVGSDFLVAIGRAIKNAVRGGDSVFRYGGDEFVVILQALKHRQAWEIAERLRGQIERRSFGIRGVQVRTTVSVGLATYPETASDVDTLLQLADKAMYSVKKSSRNAVQSVDGPCLEPEVNA